MKKIILVVEDQPEIRKLICMTMDYDASRSTKPTMVKLASRWSAPCARASYCST